MKIIRSEIFVRKVKNCHSAHEDYQKDLKSNLNN